MPPDATHGEPTSELGSDHAYLSSAIDADSARAAEESKSESPAATAGEAKKETDTGEADHDEEKTKKKSGGGGFLKSLGLGGGGSKKKEEEEAQAGAEKAREEREEKEKHLPPNHLGSAVPAGASTDLADPGTVAPGQTDGLAASKSPTSPTTGNDAAERSDSLSQLPDRSTSVGSASSPRSGSGSQQPQLAGSRGEHRGSMIPADAPRYKRVENPDRIPTAGGKRIGEEQYQTRRASVAPSSSSPPRDMPKLDREGSPDPVTAGNTESNTKASGGNTAPKEMKEFSMGDASKEAEAKGATGGAAEDVAPDEGGRASSVGATSGGSGSGSALKEKLSPSSGGGSGSGSGGHARRGSVFDKLKEKMKSKGSKSP